MENRAEGCGKGEGVCVCVRVCACVCVLETSPSSSEAFCTAAQGTVYILLHMLLQSSDRNSTASAIHQLFTGT